MNAIPHDLFPMQRRAAMRDVRRVRIGLVNNMPDTALESTERQFVALFGNAAPDFLIDWQLFSLGTVVRSDTGRQHLASRGYGTMLQLEDAHLDALIVTGTEPVQPDLRQEPYWPELASLFNWIEREGPSAMFSCLASHAAVLHFDGIERRRMPAKRFGLFDHGVASPHRMTALLTSPFRVAHSRWNELAPDDLSEAGYEILTYAPRAGVDLFIRRRRNLMMFFQGHPEYDLGTLGREYRRDVRRYLAGMMSAYPNVPEGYFSAEAAAQLDAFRERGLLDRNKSLMDEFPDVLPDGDGSRSPLGSVFRTWLQQIAHADGTYARELARASL
jgi:homoserine O-succinyltransferase